MTADNPSRGMSLREFEIRLDSLHRHMDEQYLHLRELIDSRGESLDEALKLRTTEMARRLQELNHAHSNAIENWRQSLPRELFHATIGEWQVWRDSVNAHISKASSVASDLSAQGQRLSILERSLNQATGAMLLVRFMGFAGVIALLLTFLRMANVIP